MTARTKTFHWVLALTLMVLTCGVSASAEDHHLRLETSMNSESYAPGDTIEVSVEAFDSHGSPLSSIKEAKIEIKDPGGRKRFKKKFKRVHGNTLEASYTLAPDAVLGTWRLKIKVESRGEAKEKITFFVGTPEEIADNVPQRDADDEDDGDEEDGGSPLPNPDGQGGGGGDQLATCLNCHSDRSSKVACDNQAWMGHDRAMVAHDLFMLALTTYTGGTCDQAQTGDGHDSITQWNGTATCLGCHEDEAAKVHSSLHYQWLGPSPYMTHGPELQGKLEVAVNSYCINIKGNWNGCGSCHAGLGAPPSPEATREQLENIDCLVCHQKGYKRKKIDGVMVPDLDNMTMDMVEAAKTVHLPERSNCLQCHAKGGGGDNFKRGDMALAHGNTSDRQFDVHMATTGADLRCQDCHHTQDHKMAGRGSDLRVTELDQPVSCRDCHQGRVHDEEIERHTDRVACQACHIPLYAKNASDTAASEMTEIYRDWLDPHPTASGAIHPTPTMAGDLAPAYRWWNGFSDNYVLYDQARPDPATGRIPTSKPMGAIDDPGAKLYPFKYKTALQPIDATENILIALDTSVYFTTGDAQAAAQAGLVNMGLNPGDQVRWIETETYQLITHEVAPAGQALGCRECHYTNSRMDLQGQLGYAPKAPLNQVCSQCHEYEEPLYFEKLHEKHVKDKKYDCSWCHGFSRPERGLRMP